MAKKSQLPMDVMCKEVVAAHKAGKSNEEFTADIVSRYDIKDTSLAAKVSTGRAILKASSATYSYKKKEYNGVQLAAQLNVDVRKVSEQDGVEVVKEGYVLPYLSGKGRESFDALALVSELT